MNILKSLLFSSAIVIPVYIAASEPLSPTKLTAEGTRIGQAYNAALKAHDSAGQNAALAEFNDLLATLRKQEQIDIFSSAFTHANIAITSPDKDAVIYSRAIINAMHTGDSTGIEDANDIALTVLLRYENETDAATARQYRSCYDAAISASRLGYELSTASSDSISSAITNHAETLRTTFSADSVASKIWNNCFDFHSIRLSSIEDDAAKYATRLKNASKSGSQDQLDAELRIIGYVYERYYLDRSEADAKQFNSRVNELYEQP